MDFDSVSYQVIRAALRVHSQLGPGLFEAVYKACLGHELQKAGLKVVAEVALPVIYDGVQLEIGYKIDLLIEDALIIELKAVESLAPLHRAQLITYLKLANKEVGLLINFNTPHLRQGIVRIVNSRPPSRPPM